MAEHAESGDYDWEPELQPGESLLWVGRREPRPDKIGAATDLIGRVLVGIPLLFFGLVAAVAVGIHIDELGNGSAVRPVVSAVILLVGGGIALASFGAVAVMFGHPLYKRRVIRSQRYAITNRRVQQRKRGNVTSHPLNSTMSVTSKATIDGHGNVTILNPLSVNQTPPPTKVMELEDIADCAAVVDLLNDVIAGEANPARQGSRSWDDYLVDAEHVHWYGESQDKDPHEDKPAAYAIVDNELLTIAHNKLTVLPITQDLEVTSHYGADDFGTVVFESAERSVSFGAISGCAQVVEIVEALRRAAPDTDETQEANPSDQQDRPRHSTHTTRSHQLRSPPRTFFKGRQNLDWSPELRPDEQLLWQDRQASSIAVYIEKTPGRRRLSVGAAGSETAAMMASIWAVLSVVFVSVGLILRAAFGFRVASSFLVIGALWSLIALGFFVYSGLWRPSHRARIIRNLFPSAHYAITNQRFLTLVDGELRSVPITSDLQIETTRQGTNGHGNVIFGSENDGLSFTNVAEYERVGEIARSTRAEGTGPTDDLAGEHATEPNIQDR